jgi:hypothetical protein
MMKLFTLSPLRDGCRSIVHTHGLITDDLDLKKGFKLLRHDTYGKC